MPSVCASHSNILCFPPVVAEEATGYAAAARAGSVAVRPPVELDALELHRRIVAFQRLSDRSRLEFLRLLAVLDDGRRYLELGYSSTKHYPLQEFNVGRTNALELVRVARRLRELPVLTAALADSEIRWSTLKALSRVATTENETEWLAFAKRHTLEQIEHEVKRAIAERRDKPAEASDYGLTNIMTRVSFDLTLEEKERFMTAMARLAAEMGEGAPTDLASLQLFLSQRILEGAPVASGATVHNLDGAGAEGEGGASVHSLECAEGGATVHNLDGDRADGGAKTSPAPGLTVVYHQYADGTSTVDTADGPVRVDAEVVDRVADVAQTVTLTAADVAEPKPLPDGAIDRPNSSALARKVRARNGERCANPGCGTRRGVQAHHIRYRASGGPTVPGNETAICRTCHTLVHAGLIEIERGPGGKLEWRPRIRSVAVAQTFDPSPQIAELMADVPLPASSATAPALDVDALVDGLTSLGLGRRAARDRLDAAMDALGPSATEEAAVLREALRMSA